MTYRSEELARHAWRAFRVDSYNRRRYGAEAPRYLECNFVDVEAINTYLVGWGDQYSAHVLAGEWDATVRPIAERPKYQACRRHWVDGLSWEHSGILEIADAAIRQSGHADGCRTVEDVLARYRNLDRIFDRVAEDGTFTPQKELGRYRFRGEGEIRAHIAQGPTVVFGGSGWHRIAIAKIVGVKLIPFRIGLVHAASEKLWREMIQLTPP